MNQDFKTLITQTPLSTSSLVIALLLGFAITWLIKMHFVKFSSSLSNKESFAQIFPFIALTTILMITVVKTSLALSLGLVGALSIVRFRTPIKDPEELAYLFFSIAVGLGLGANQFIPVIVASAVIMFATAIVKWKSRADKQKAMYLSIDIENVGDDFKIEDLNTALTKYVDMLNLRRFDTQGQKFSGVYFIQASEPDNLSKMNRDFVKEYPNIQMTFIDQNQLPSI